MLSFLTAAVFGYCISIASGSCPYVANYYYTYSDSSGGYTSSTYSAGTAFMLNTCAIEENIVNDVSYASEQFECINDEVYIGFYTGTTCEGTAGESVKVTAVSVDYPEYARAQYAYSCEDTGCTNYAQVLVSQSAYDALVEASNSGQSLPQCRDPGLNDWFDLYGIKFITDVCVDSTGNATEPESSMKFTCGSWGFSVYTYIGDRQCNGNSQVETHEREGCNELAPGVEIWTKVVCGNEGPTPTARPSMPTSAPSKRPSIAPTPAPTDNPTEGTMSPTPAPTENPTETSSAPSAAPTGLSGSPTATPTKAPSMPTVTPTAVPTKVPIVGFAGNSGTATVMALRGGWAMVMMLAIICL